MSVQIETPDTRVINYDLILMFAKEKRVDEAAEMILDHRLSLAHVAWNLDLMDEATDFSDFMLAVADYLISKYILGDTFMENNCEY